MGTFFSRLKSGNKLSVPAWASTDGWWWTEEPPLNIVAGESFYEAALSKIVNRPRETGWLVPLDLVLQREPRNKHDKNAIAVKTGTVRRPGEQLGHVARDWAAWLAPVLDATRAPLFQVRGVVRGGWLEAPSVGVCLWLDGLDPDERFTAMLSDKIDWTPDVRYWSLGLGSPDCPPLSAGFAERDENWPVIEKIRSYPNWPSRWSDALE